MVLEYSSSPFTLTKLGHHAKGGDECNDGGQVSAGGAYPIPLYRLGTKPSLHHFVRL